MIRLPHRPPPDSTPGRGDASDQHVGDDGNPPAILARGLTKSYRDVPAVRGVDLHVSPGEIYGFLGPNGAGKSTVMSILCTLTRPTSGQALVAGHDVVSDPRAARHHIGLVFQETTLDVELTARENLSLHAELYGMGRRAARARSAEMLELVDLGDRADEPVRAFSGGMKRRVEIARALTHSPRVLFLDEPTAGLDPQTRAHVWGHLRDLPDRENTTLFVTTHYLEEAEYCHRLSIVDHGRVVVTGTPTELKSVLRSDRVEIGTADDRAAVEALRTRHGLAATTGPSGVTVHVPDGAAFVPILCASFPVPIQRVTVTRPSLDEVFLHHTGREIRTDRPNTGGAVAGDAPVLAGER